MEWLHGFYAGIAAGMLVGMTGIFFLIRGWLRCLQQDIKAESENLRSDYLVKEAFKHNREFSLTISKASKSSEGGE